MIILIHYVYLIARCLKEYVMKSYRKKRVDQNNSLEQNVIVSSDVICDDLGIRFIPPVYVQRYLAVCKILEEDRWCGSIKKVIDFGCAELGFFPYLKNVAGVEEMLEVDVDRELLRHYKCRAAPLTSDYLKKRHDPLAVHVLVGSVAEQDSRLRGSDAVVCIELIEHLYPDTLEALPYTVFEYIRPRVAIFTTPNSEFNVLLPNLQGFRHDDHKFEWTREQFACWAHNLTTRFPRYSVSFVGIAPGPEGSVRYGCCSQMAVFVRDSSDLPQGVEIVDPNIKDENVYELLETYLYPFEVDTRTVEEKIRDETIYYISSYGSSHMYDTENDEAHIPLDMLMPLVKKWCSSIDKLREVLENSCWQVVQSRGKLCVVYTHRRWSNWLDSDDQDAEEEVAMASACEQLTPEPELRVQEETAWDPPEALGDVDRCWTLDAAPSGQGGRASSVAEGDWGSSDGWMPENIVQEGSSGEGVCETFALHASECSVLRSEEHCRAEQDGVTTLYSGDGDVSVRCDISSDKNILKQCPDNTCDQGLTDVSKDCDACGDSCDSAVTVLKNGHVATDETSVDDSAPVIESGSISVTQVSDVIQTAADLSGGYGSGKSCSKRSEHAERECGLPCAQGKRPSRSLDAALEEGSTVDSCSLEEQNDRAADSGYPNSTDMDLDLTPEQVDEISTENDVQLTGNSSLDEDSEYEGSASGSEGEGAPVLHLPGEVLLDAGPGGMENGDVANNNQDEEGNHAEAAAPREGDVAVADLAAMLDLENENDPVEDEPFPDWLLRLLGVAGAPAEPWSEDEDSSSVSMHDPEPGPSSAGLPGAAADTAP
ncbi:uncharacterized protein LOC134541951 [Bacillus rossius redtenbacheri]|uniref:uncharacterized protein LOC134541951 n=1 Tax=Bacillus rossius redtenbacheri TaxID=93214 RepID=UPI002FDD9FFB